MIEGLACAWPTGSAGSRESPANAGVARWTDRAGQQAAPAWSEHGLSECHDPPRINVLPAGWCCTSSAGLLLTCGGPFRYLAEWSR